MHPLKWKIKYSENDLNVLDLDIGLALYWWQSNFWRNADIPHSA